MLLMADPDRAEGASTHNLEDGQRNGRRELSRARPGYATTPRAGLMSRHLSRSLRQGLPRSGSWATARQPTVSRLLSPQAVKPAALPDQAAAES